MIFSKCSTELCPHDNTVMEFNHTCQQTSPRPLCSSAAGRGDDTETVVIQMEGGRWNWRQTDESTVVRPQASVASEDQRVVTEDTWTGSRRWWDIHPDLIWNRTGRYVKCDNGTIPEWSWLALQRQAGQELISVTLPKKTNPDNNKICPKKRDLKTNLSLFWQIVTCTQILVKTEPQKA